MRAGDTQHGTGTGLVIIVASAVACVAIIAASAVVARKPPAREDFLALVPTERERPPGPGHRADEEENAPAEEDPRPAELIARAEKLLADGSRDRAQIEGLLLAAVKSRPGTEESIEAFKLLRGLYEKWREEDSKHLASVEKTELPSPPRLAQPVEAPPAPASLPAAPTARVAPPTPGFVSLVEQGLPGWGRPTAGTWKVEGGGILGDCMDASGYMYTRKRFRDFVLKLKVTPLAKAGVTPHLRLRFRWVPEKGKYGCQVDLAAKVYFYRRLEELKSPEQVFTVPVELRPQVGSSLDVELVAVGQNVTFVVQGKQVFSATAEIIEQGQLGLCVNRGSVLFERVEIKEH